MDQWPTGGRMGLRAGKRSHLNRGRSAIQLDQLVALARLRIGEPVTSEGAGDLGPEYRRGQSASLASRPSSGWRLSSWAAKSASPVKAEDRVWSSVDTWSVCQPRARLAASHVPRCWVQDFTAGRPPAPGRTKWRSPHRGSSGHAKRVVPFPGWEPPSSRSVVLCGPRIARGGYDPSR